MTNKELANIMYPNTLLSISDYEVMYPKRNLDSNQAVTRFAPSPTGVVHMGSLLTTFIASKVASDTNGIFYLRIEDTDQLREVENGISSIVSDLSNFEITIDEGAISATESRGIYGPYIQSKRIKIYETFAKYLVENDFAYPCFCKPEEMSEIREYQEKKKDRIGYYGRYAKCRYLKNEEKAEKIKNGEKFVLRIKSNGDFEKKTIVKDLVRGKIEFPQNDIDHILIKNNGIPVYHFAHVVDDHLMRTTHILRGEEWLPSTPLHIELFNMFDFKVPKYAHLGLLMKIDEDGTRRKLSKRKDPEAAVSFYHKQGIPIDAVKLYLMTIANSNFEAWMDCNPKGQIKDFKFDFKKMSLSGTLFDVEKLLNISKKYISKLSALEVYNNTLNWALIYDVDYAKLLESNKEFSIRLFNIERVQKKPRKDYESYSTIKDQTWYMYNELFLEKNLNYEWQNINELSEINKILNNYILKYSEDDEKDVWFDKIKLVCDELGYASNMKEYKENKDKYKGNIADVSNVIRVALTTKYMTPELYEIMKMLGKETISKRFKQINK